MDWLIPLMMFATGTLGGVINAIAGGATLITFPAMIATGMPPITANASNALAILPGHLVAIVADWKKRPSWGINLLWSMLICFCGGVIGAVILLLLPDALFTLPIPALIGFSTLLFVYAPNISDWAERRRQCASPSKMGERVMLAVSSVYGGFFGAGLGVILTAVLAINQPNDIRQIKALKNLLATCVSLSAVIIFVWQGRVQWPETRFMLAGAMVGGYIGGYLIRILPAQYVRGVVIVAGAVMTVVYAVYYWF